MAAAETIDDCRWPSDPLLDSAFGAAGEWPAMRAGTPITIVKRDPDGVDVVRYPAIVLPDPAPPGWLVTEARWVNRPVELDGLVFHTGDRLVESFSPRAAFNCFAVHDPETGILRGWYANVTLPATLDLTTDPPTLTWHDLYLDIVGTPEGVVALRDEDELAESGLETTNARLHAAIVVAGQDVISRLRARQFPFDDAPRNRQGPSRR